MEKNMLITILIISFYLAGILFYIQSKPPTQKPIKSLLWPVLCIFWLIKAIIRRGNVIWK